MVACVVTDLLRMNRLEHKQSFAHGVIPIYPTFKGVYLDADFFESFYLTSGGHRVAGEPIPTEVKQAGNGVIGVGVVVPLQLLVNPVQVWPSGIPPGVNIRKSVMNQRPGVRFE
jgi:hypothetical protein